MNAISVPGMLISPQPDLVPDVFYLMVRIFLLMLVLLYIYIYIYIYIYVVIRQVSPFHRPRRPLVRVEVQLYSIFDLGTRRGDGSASSPAATYPRERLGAHFTGGWVSLSAGLDRYGKSRPHRDSISGPTSPQAVAIPTTLPGPLNRNNIPPIMIKNRLYENTNLLSLQLASFLVGLRTYQHPGTQNNILIQFYRRLFSDMFRLLYVGNYKET